MSDALSLDQRLDALHDAAERGVGVLDDSVVESVRALTERLGTRARIGLEDTVTVVVGPTGAGKSTLFNALAGRELATPGHRRPTTSTATAAVWGDVDDALLDWLDARDRHRIGDDESLDHLVLMDVPDFDSIERAHQLEVDRLVELCDLMVWVVDPQKYADASLHDGYLKPLRRHAGSMVVALNQADRLDDDARERCVADMSRLLTEDGLTGVPVIATSGLTGLGMDDLRSMLRTRVSARQAASTRLGADITDLAHRIGAECGDEPAAGIRDVDHRRLDHVLAAAAGVPVVVAAAAKAHRRRGALATGWPLLRWLRRLRPDPLRRLHLRDRTPADDRMLTSEELRPSRTSLAGASLAQRAQIDAAARELANNASAGLPDAWRRHTRAVALADEERLVARLDEAIAGSDLRMRRPMWWSLASMLQALLVVVMVVGLLWLGLIFALGYFQIQAGDLNLLPRWHEVPWPTLLAIGGAIAGLLMAALFGGLVRLGARRRARVAERAMTERVRTVGEELIVAPVKASLARRDEVRMLAARAATGPDESRRRGRRLRRGARQHVVS